MITYNCDKIKRTKINEDGAKRLMKSLAALVNEDGGFAA